ncbi:lipid droplet-regulating VLDL assembly factor AUP1 isoform 2-T2 [Sylvia borin]
MEPPAAPGPERLFDSHRFPTDGFLLLALLLYAPVGLCLLVLRVFIGVHVFLVSCALPDSVVRRFIVRVMCSVLGLLVRQSDPRLREAGARVFIANHVTPFDHNVVSLLTSCNTSVADSSWITELLWTFFVPFTVYQVRWMPSVPRQADERSEEFALRVQELLAMELGVVSTRITAADRTEHMKRLRHTSRLPFAPALSQRPAARPRVPPSLPGAAPEDVRVVAMAQQVKEVLPHVPLEVIKTDLVQTNCVDTTIANLLEGRVPFFPESKETEDLPAPSTSQAAAASGIQGSVAASSSKPATKQFAKSSVERHLSLQERKRALYDYARRRFAEKHGAARAGGSP